MGVALGGQGEAAIGAGRLKMPTESETSRILLVVRDNSRRNESRMDNNAASEAEGRDKKGRATAEVDGTG